MPWPPHTSFVSHLGHPSKNVLDMPLSGRAAKWALAMWEGNPQLCFSYQWFVAEMRGVFNHLVRGKEAGNRLLLLRQGYRSVADYAIEFSTLAMESGWDEPALMGIFLCSLNDRLRDELVARDVSKSLADLMDPRARKTPGTRPEPHHFHLYPVFLFCLWPTGGGFNSSRWSHSCFPAPS